MGLLNTPCYACIGYYTVDCWVLGSALALAGTNSAVPTGMRAAAAVSNPAFTHQVAP